ncbi:MAG: response regulator [Bacteroidota bacterium]|nr:response regulator [Bacteroidota bacterium]
MNKVPKILIVDDKPENLIALEVVLKDLDIELIKATSGNDALRETLHHDFALALLDIQMPEMDGYELAGILREEEKTAQLPFIFISAVYTDNLNVFKGYEKGAFSFITKPFQPEILINKVKFFIEKHQQEIALYELNKDLEQKNIDLQFAMKELESFSYSVSHDLRAPLRAIGGYSRILKEDYESIFDDSAKRTLGMVIKNANRMGQLIDDLLAFSRLGKQHLSMVNLNMNSLNSSIASELRAHYPDRKIEIDIQPLLNAKGDNNMVRHVLTNLISNAIKYSGKQEKSHIEIGCYKEDKNIVYYIKDNGVGFDMNYYDKLFGVFQRLHNDSDFEGTGIGLSIVKRIITKHGGRVWATSEINNGATFYFSLQGE